MKIEGVDIEQALENAKTQLEQDESMSPASKACLIKTLFGIGGGDSSDMGGNFLGG